MQILSSFARIFFSKHYGNLLCIIAPIFGLVFLFIMIFTSPLGPVYDEPFYIKYTQLLDQVGLSSRFLNLLPGTPGPLVAFAQYAAKPLTGIAPPGIRVVNALLLLICIVLCALTARASGSAQWLTTGLSAISIPVVWPAAGLGLSDMPAWVFVSLCVYCLVRWMKTPGDAQKKLLLWGICAGLSLGFAVLGRQNSLVILACPALYALTKRKYLASSIVLAITVTIVVAPVFWVWQGLVPPGPLHVPLALSPRSVVISFLYMGIFMFILAPGFYRWRPAWIVGSLVVGFIFANKLSFVPMNSATKYLNPALIYVYQTGISMIIIALPLYFCGCTINRLRHDRQDAIFGSAILGSFVIAMTAVVSPNYSSRYTTLAFPFLLLISDRYAHATIWKATRILLGMTLGALSLWTYYQLPSWRID
jgi:hypothetical protein